MSDVGVNFCTVKVDMDKCNLCLECVDTCPNDALSFDGAVSSVDAMSSYVLLSFPY